MCTAEGECLATASRTAPEQAAPSTRDEPRDVTRLNDVPVAALAAPGASPSARRHDGFFLRLGIGPSFEGEAGGFGGAFECALGGTVGSGLVVGAMTSPKVLQSSGRTGEEVAVFSFVGPFIDYYLNPSKGLHILGGAGVATTFSGHSEDVAVSLETFVGAGYEWWVGDQWSVGLLGRLSLLNPGGIRSNEFNESALPMAHGLVTFTYHLADVGLVA
jgi:hypothetical protein